MKIVSLHIENFGKLHDYNLNLDDGLNVIKEDNGWGKSTLAAFIRAMFYGFDGELKRGSDNERKRFKPWQGGAYGGTLKFETKGILYEIERNFGNKALEDVFVLRNASTNMESDKFSSNIGEELFHINRDSFLKTVFISQNDCASSGSTDDINSRIGNISDSTDLNKFESVDKALKDAINHLGTTATGRQGRLKNEITAKNVEINRGADIPGAMDEIMSRIDEREEALGKLKEENRGLNEKRNKASRLSKKLALKESYESLLSEEKDKTDKLEETKKWFPGNLPEKKRLNEWEKADEEMRKQAALMGNSELSGAEKIAYETYSDMFKNGMPDADEAEVMYKKAASLGDMRLQAMRFRVSPEEEMKFGRYREIFGNDENPAEEIRKLNIEWANKCSMELKLNTLMEQSRASKEDLLHKTERAINGKLRIHEFSGIIFDWALLFFVVTMVMKGLSDDLKGTYLITSVIVGVVSLTVSLIFVFLTKKAKSMVTVDADKMQSEAAAIMSLRAEIARITQKVSMYLKKHGCNVGIDEYYESLMKLLEDSKTYELLLERKNESKNNDKSVEASVLSREIAAYLEVFGVSASEDDYTARITDIKNKAERYISLDNKINEYKKAEKTLETTRDALYEQLRGFGFEPMLNLEGQLEEISKHLDEYDDAESLLNDVKSRKVRFEEENNMEEILAPVGEDERISMDELDRLQSEIDEKIETIEDSQKTDRGALDRYKEKYELLQEEKDELEALNEELSEVKERHRLYGLTREYLNIARESLTTKYIGPLKDGFDKYYKLLTDTPGDDYKLDANLNLTKTEQGGQRSTESLSYGYQDLCGLCMRLSMADAMYKGEKPVLVCDDPFVNLDDGKMEGSRKLIKAVSDDYQIIYMTCRENRI